MGIVAQGAYLARVNSRAGEGVLVGSHLVAGCALKATRCCVVDRGLAMANGRLRVALSRIEFRVSGLGLVSSNLGFGPITCRSACLR